MRVSQGDLERRNENVQTEAFWQQTPFHLPLVLLLSKVYGGEREGVPECSQGAFLNSCLYFFFYPRFSNKKIGGREQRIEVAEEGGRVVEDGERKE